MTIVNYYKYIQKKNRHKRVIRALVYLNHYLNDYQTEWLVMKNKMLLF